MSFPVLMRLLRDRLSFGLQPRVPEPELVMQSSAQTTSFALAGEEDGALAFLYLYNAVQISSLLRAGQRGLDLACGPANQLSRVVRLNPDQHWVGLDASAPMLEHARSALHQAGLPPATFVQGDMTRLEAFSDASFDVVTCTLALHHLPDLTALDATLAEIRRVLKPDGRVYLMDFGRLKRRSTQRFFADDLQQSAQFTEDYFNSLRAAFSVAELSGAAARAGLPVQCHATSLVPFLVVLCSDARQAPDAQTLVRMQAALAALPPDHQYQFANIARWLGMGGLRLKADLL